jgi:hypothetical protein
VNATENLLRRLAANDELYLRAVLSPRRPSSAALDRVTKALVELSALVVADAATASLRWSVERALSTGLEDAAVIQVLLSAASAAGAAQTVASAPRLALALDLDIEVDGWDGT